ncbi:MAG: hypothetical protein IIB03_10170, partial [Acidobacteria bacterium]|nr:hypothetical protein [Acidobacteriota bacterium]
DVADTGWLLIGLAVAELAVALEAEGDILNLVSGGTRGAAIEYGLIAATLQKGIVDVTPWMPKNVGDFVSSSLDKIAAVSALGKLPDSVADLLEGFAEKFLPPEAEDLFDENGTLIGVKRPDIVVFDEDGNPIGKQLGDIFAVNLDGTIDEEGELPDIFYIADPFDDEAGTGLAVAGLIDLLPTVARERGDIGLLETWIPNLVAFDENGDIVHTIFEFDEEGNLSGTKAFSGEFVDENGRPLDIPINEFLKTDEEGNIIGQKEIPFVALDENGEIHEFILPEPIVHDEDGNAIGIQLPSVFLVGEDGRLDGLKVGGVITKEFLLGLEALRPDHDIPLDAVFDSDRVLFDSEGIAHTADEFRPSMIIRDEDGEVVGHRIATEITCITSKCLEEISLNQKILALIEEAVHVLVEDAEGGFTIAELKGVALHDENGEFVGVVNPQTLLIDQESGRVKGFLESKTDLIEEFKEFFTGVKDFFDESGEHLGTFDAELEKSQFFFALERGDEFKPQEFAHVDEFGEKLDPGDLPDFRGFSVTDLEDFAVGEAFGGDLGFSQEELKQLFAERSKDHVDEGPAPDGQQPPPDELKEPPPDGEEPPPDEQQEPPPDDGGQQEPPPDGNQQP